MTNPDQEKKKNKRSKWILILGIFTLLTVGSWVIFDVYRSLVKSTVPIVLQKQIQPIDSKVDPNLMGNLKARRQFTTQELNSVHPNPALLSTTISPTPRIIQKESSQSASVSKPKESTQSASGSL